jgi:hypothetical protein
MVIKSLKLPKMSSIKKIVPFFILNTKKEINLCNFNSISEINLRNFNSISEKDLRMFILYLLLLGYTIKQILAILSKCFNKEDLNKKDFIFIDSIYYNFFRKDFVFVDSIYYAFLLLYVLTFSIIALQLILANTHWRNESMPISFYIEVFFNFFTDWDLVFGVYVPIFIITLILFFFIFLFFFFINLII